MKKIKIFLNSLMIFFFASFIGHAIYEIYKFKTQPELFATQSAPWYTNILFYGVFTFIVLFICFILKLIFKRKS